jgi:hypothetical protein
MPNYLWCKLQGKNPPEKRQYKSKSGSGQVDSWKDTRLTGLAAGKYTDRQRMLLAREFVDYLSRQLIKKLTPNLLETADPARAAEIVSQIIEEELAIEDRLNDEVRDILDQYSEYMRKEGVSYQEMFRRIKNTLISQRKVIRASGRDTGDQMKLSRDKINDISHKLVSTLRKNREFRVKRDPNEVRLELVKAITDLLMTEEKVDKQARLKIRSQKRDIPEGTEEWDLLHRRYYAEELRKLGIDLTR